MTSLGSIFDGPSNITGDARAMTPEEIENWQIQNVSGMAQAVFPDQYSRLRSNYQATQLTLDERFADFKVRLAAAIARRSK